MPTQPGSEHQGEALYRVPDRNHVGKMGGRSIGQGAHLIAGIRYRGKVQIRQVDLMSSRLTAAGPRYEILGSAPVGAAEKRRAASRSA